MLGKNGKFFISIIFIFSFDKIKEIEKIGYIFKRVGSVMNYKKV